MGIKFPITLRGHDTLRLRVGDFNVRLTVNEPTVITRPEQLIEALQNGEGVTGDDFEVITGLVALNAEGEWSERQ